MNLAWTKLREEPYRAGWRKMIKKYFKLLNGKETNYDIKDEGKSCCSLVLTPENNIILVKVFRPGPEEVLMEMPSGFVNKDEDPKIATLREVLEETGYKGEVEFVGISIDDAYSNSLRHTFVIKNAVKIQEPHWEEDEECEIITISLPEFRKHLRSGQLTHVEAGYLALDYLKLL